MAEQNVNELRDLLAVMLEEMSQSSGLSVWGARGRAPLTASQIRQVCRTGGMLQLGLLAPADVLTLQSMEGLISEHCRGALTDCELILELKQAWARLETVDANWMDSLYRRMAGLLQTVSSPQPGWSAAGRQQLFEAQRIRISQLLTTARTQAP